MTDIRPQARQVKRPWWSAFVPSTVIESDVTDLRRDSSLIASAQRIIAGKIKGGSHRRTEAWMGEAWTMFDLVGELHFLATTLARRASRARFYVGRVEGGDVIELTAPGEDTTVDATQARQDKKAQAIYASLGDGFIGLQEIVERTFVNQFVVGANYLVGAHPDTWNSKKGDIQPPIKTLPVKDLEWRALSVREFNEVGGGYELKQAGSASNSEEKSLLIAGPAAYVITLWNPHPADSTTPDSPVRATLPVLRELVGLTQHVSAQIDSRLAGAGILVMRSSASRAIKRALGLSEDDPRDVFTEQLIDAMVTPIADRDSASAIVPLVITIPDESKAPEYVSMHSELDQQAGPLREEAIRRTALGLDAPPELLLGQGDTSHWTAWLTQEEVVDSHIAPTLALIARAFTIKFLRPILRAHGLSAVEAEKYAIWFDTSELTVKANIAQDSRELHSMGLVSDETVRRANGFDESDAPKQADVKEQAIDLVRDMVVANPGLMNRPGLDVLVEQMTALLEGKPQSGLAASKAAIESSGSADIPDAPGEEQSTENPASAGVSQAAPGTRPPGAVQAPRATVSTPTVPTTRAAAAATTDTFGTWDGE